MSDIDAALKAEIDKHLPTMVGKQLQERLVQAERDARDLKISRSTNDDLEAAKKKLEKLQINQIEVSAREKAADVRERALEVKEAILTLKEKHAEERVNEIRGLTDRVFASNRMSYNMNLQVPNPSHGQKDQYGNMLPGSWDQTAPVRGIVEKAE